MTTTHPRRFGFKRWVVLGMMVLGGWLAFGVGGIFKPVSPAVVLPPEPIWPGLRLLPDIPALGLKDVWFSNTILSALIADIILIGAAVGARRFVKSGKLVPQGFYNFFEWLVEFLWNMTESAAGKWAKAMFPIMATIFLLVFTANMVKLLPGFESIGYLKEAHGTIKGYAPVELIPGFLYTIDGSHPVEHLAEAHGQEPAAPHEGESEPAGALCHSCEVVPSLRATATDLNFTFALAVVAVIMIQYFGFRALGTGYLGKFFNLRTIISKPIFGFIDFGVGLLELVSEFAKILSFGFRLFGNIFAGALLLAILGALTAVAVPSMLYGLEAFVGVIQAYVFSMLALTFMSQATVGHGGDEHAEGTH